jgi:hypothetical protein
MELTLDKAIALAADSSLEAFRMKNLFLSGYWEYRTYQAGRLPSLTLDLRRHSITEILPEGMIRKVTWMYIVSSSLYAGGSLEMKQNFDLFGGTFFLDSDLGYIRNFGDNTYSQFTSVPVRLGYRQSLLGYNPFKWSRKIEPLKYEKVKKEFIYNMEGVSEQVTNHFFVLAMAQAEYDLAKENVASTDTLYITGKRRHEIAAISQADLLTLRWMR